MIKTLFSFVDVIIIWVNCNVQDGKSFSRALSITMLFCGLVLAGTVQVSAEAPGVIVIIGSDTTWTKVASPHNITGPIIVMDGVTLTIEAGATVNLNDYYILVNGTLYAIGSNTNPIQFVDGKIEFTQYSNGWDEQTGFGCIIEKSILMHTLIVINESPKINSNSMWSIHVEGGSPVISKNNITGGILYESNVLEGSPVISNNNIKGGKVGRSDTTTISVSIGGTSPVISNNIINGTVEIKGHGGSPVISNNSITPPYSYTSNGSLVPAYEKWGIGIILEGNNDNAIISYNILLGCSSGIKIGGAGSATIEGNTICENTETGIDVAAVVDLTIIGNLISNNRNNGIKDYWGKANMIIRNNTITKNSYGISDPGPYSIIERNWIIDNNVGIELGSQATVQNNTITNSTVAIRLDYCPSATINYNNIENYLENSIYLEDTSDNIDASYNWWGTTDTQAINLTIRDYKYDFNLGKVSFVPFLT